MKDKQIAISIIVPVYNVEKYISRCIDSILSQTFDDFELILVNDGSTDKSFEICKKYQSQDYRIKVLTGPNRGSSNARNTGLEIATGKYILHIDSDDWIEPNMLELLYSTAEIQKADIAACNIYTDDGEGNLNIQNYLYSIESRKDIFGVKAFQCAVWNKLVRRDLYLKYDIRFVPGITMWEDVVVTTRLRFHSNKTVIVNQPLYHYFNAPRVSICSEFKGRYPESQIKVTRFLEEYFNRFAPKDKDMAKAISNLKLLAKWDLLYYKTLGGASEWKKLFQESNRKIWHSQFSLTRKAIMTIACILPAKVFDYSYQHLLRIKA